MIGSIPRKKLGAFAVSTAVILALDSSGFATNELQLAVASKSNLKVQFALGVGNSRCHEWLASGESTDRKSPISQWLLGVVSGNNFFVWEGRVLSWTMTRMAYSGTFVGIALHTQMT